MPNELSKAELASFLSFASTIADRTRGLILELWGGNSFNETLKEDQTPVTQVDLDAEQLVREMLTKQYPAHGIIGEEYGSTNSGSEFQWTVDPIDGTQNLVNRIPTFGTLLGLRFKGEAVLGVIDHPVLNIRTSGAKGLGVVHNGVPVVLKDLQSEWLTVNDLVATNSLSVFGRKLGEQYFHGVMSFHPQARIYYDCYAHTLAVLGSIAVVVEPNLKIWDISPSEALITEAGGSFCSFAESDAYEPNKLFNSVFGKKRAVGLMMEHLARLQSDT